MSHTPTNTKWYSHACEYYIVYTTKVPNIVTVLLVTVYPDVISSLFHMHVSELSYHMSAAPPTHSIKEVYLSAHRRWQWLAALWIQTWWAHTLLLDGQVDSVGAERSLASHTTMVPLKNPVFSSPCPPHLCQPCLSGCSACPYYKALHRSHVQASHEPLVCVIGITMCPSCRWPTLQVCIMAVMILFPYCSILLIVHSRCLLTWRGRGSVCFLNTAYLLVHSPSTFSFVSISSDVLTS